MIRILIADDHPIMRDGLKKILNEEPDMTVVGEASNYHEALTAVKKNVPDIAILDISMPGRNGLDILKELRSLYPRLKVLILSMHPEDRFALRAIKAGAAGYVTKENATEQLVNAIRKVHEGKKYISPELAMQLADIYGNGMDKLPHELLSDREYEVLVQIAEGKKVKDIAVKLALSPATVATYRARILEKMQLRSNVEITSYVYRNHLID
jgi:two-component system, NarL family, invasion response regulator UvrY